MIFVSQLRKNPGKTLTTKMTRPEIELGYAAWEAATLPLDTINWIVYYVIKLFISMLLNGATSLIITLPQIPSLQLSTCLHSHINIIIIIIIRVLPKGRSFTANSGTKFAILLRMNRCGSFPLLSAPDSRFSIWKELKRSQKVPGVPTLRWGGWI